MAISTKAFMNRKRPYVHSDIENFNIVTQWLSNNDIKLGGVIEEYENWVKQLREYEKELYDFCGVKDYIGLNEKLFGKESDTGIYIAQQVIRKSTFIRSLIPKITKQVMSKILEKIEGEIEEDKKDGLIDKLFNQSEEISITQATQALVEAMQSSFDKNKDRVDMSAVAPAFVSDIKQSINLKDIQKLKKNAKKLVENALKDNNLLISQSEFETRFCNAYSEEAKKYNVPSVSVDGDPSREDVIKQYSALIYNSMLQGKDSLQIYLSNLIGNRGEGILDFIAKKKPDGIQLEIFPIGSFSEQEVYKKYFQQLDTSSADKYMLKNHNTAKMSGTDILIKISVGGQEKFFRVQSKDSLLEQLERKRASGPYAPQVVDIIKRGSVSALLDKMVEQKIMSEAETAALAYTIANIIWFSTVGGKGTNLSGGMDLIDNIFSAHIKELIGITVSENMSKTLEINATNIFYFLGARALFPVSEVLNQIVEKLKNAEHELFNLRYIVSNKAEFAYKSSESFFEAKRKYFTNSFSGEYDPDVIEVGTEQGATIISSATGRLNFNFQIDKILNLSSYAFET